MKQDCTSYILVNNKCKNGNQIINWHIQHTNFTKKHFNNNYVPRKTLRIIKYKSGVFYNIIQK
jgi:hypothetical protein